MKTILLMALGGCLLLAGCQQNTGLVTPQTATTTTTTTVANVPTAVTSALITNYPAATAVSWSKPSPATYQATFMATSTARGATLANFKNNGQLLYSHGQIDPATLPKAITDYLTATYKGYSVVKAGSRTDKTTGAVTGYMVDIMANNLAYELRFDATGKFLSVENEDGSDEGMAIATTALPVAITSYISTNYAGGTIQNARSYMLNGVLSGYEVYVLFNSIRTELIFDATGKFISARTGGKGEDGDDGEHDNDGNGDHKGSTDVVIAQTALPATITTYLTTNYAGYTFVSAKVEQSGTTVTGYEVRLTLAGKKYEAEFSATGVLIKLH